MQIQIPYQNSKRSFRHILVPPYEPFPAVSRFEKGPQMLHVALPLVNMGEMSSIVQRDPFDLRNAVKEWLHGYVLSLILYPVDQEGGSGDSG